MKTYEEITNEILEKGFEVTIENPYCKYDTILVELIVKNLSIHKRCIFNHFHKSRIFR